MRSFTLLRMRMCVKKQSPTEKGEAASTYEQSKPQKVLEQKQSDSPQIIIMRILCFIFLLCGLIVRFISVATKQTYKLCFLTSNSPTNTFMSVDKFKVVCCSFSFLPPS